MSLRDRLNRLDERTGADRVGQGIRLYGVFVVWPVCLVAGLVLGTASLVAGRVSDAAVAYGFGILSGLLLLFGWRAERSYRAYRQSVGRSGPPAWKVWTGLVVFLGALSWPLYLFGETQEHETSRPASTPSSSPPVPVPVPGPARLSARAVESSYVDGRRNILAATVGVPREMGRGQITGLTTQSRTVRASGFSFNGMETYDGAIIVSFDWPSPMPTAPIQLPAKGGVVHLNVYVEAPCKDIAQTTFLLTIMIDGRTRHLPLRWPLDLLACG